ncbi:carbohydrate kinase [Aliiglaciecola sp. 3_MG-2023]|uniref:carbohydrate kinase family protein n=1 Tax=Aliiglaciecola sp. 3_MG-2023 TaxID=3062644 RepID=UPI0026E2DD42|nr:carbohydrate kinase [Aliiglaciecola sp. 3_MG-2023]MDO6694165.1 carbohydrate kinase [Aliiglaciecola sp. 3_MG-2023]
MANPKVAVFGEALFDMIQQQDGSYQPFIGGSPFNVARSFVKQDINCSYLSPISTDYLGEKILSSVTSEGIQIPDNNRSEKNTSLALVYKAEDGKPSYRLYRKCVADLDITSEKLLSMLPEDLELFHTGSLAIVPEMLEVLIPVITTLKSRGVKISIDVNVRKGVEVNHHQYVASIWRFVEFADIVKVSDEDLELKGLYGKPEFHAKSMLDRMENGMVVLTLGEGGSHLITDKHNLFQAVHKPAVFGDTVGAGDTFFSAMLARLLKNNALSPSAEESTLKDGLRFGAVAAGLNVEKIGCNPPTFEEVETLIKTLQD